MDELSGAELADRSGVTAEQLRRLVELGIITPTPQGRFRPSDIQRIRVVDTLADAGFAPEQLGELIATGAYNLDWTSVVFPEPTAQLTTTLEQTAAATGLPEDLAARLFDAWELPRPQPGQALRADDDELLHLAVPALAGFAGDETALLGAARQLGDSLRGLAESQVRLFHTHVEERLAAEGHPDHSWSEDLNQVAASMMASLERTLVLLYRRHFEHYVLEVTVLRAEAALERAGLARRRPVRPPAIAFLDLTGYTRLTEERGDRAAAELAGRLVEIVYELAHQYGGRPVKLLGDGVMFHFPEPAQAVLCGLELVDRLPRVGLPLARVGVHSGPVVFQHGDYFGRTVNVAARITDHARPGEVLVSDQVVADADHLEAVRFEPVGPVSLKGLASPIDLSAATRAD
ncbi:MAG TPA: adenylate/guanylate cyclase domain-containing protein [Actinomycetota bacterium]|nr:adenylate/guanylate cyclase domain-containing protein [Actinomycetota bacterium]